MHGIEKRASAHVSKLLGAACALAVLSVDFGSFTLGGGDLIGVTEALADIATEGRLEKTNRRMGTSTRVASKGVARKSAHKIQTPRGNRDDIAASLAEKPSGDVWVYAENFQEEVKVNIYNDDGSFDEGALAKLDVAFRCRRTKEHRAVDPRLFEMLSRVQDRFGGKRVRLVSGFRFQRNEGSRHYHASAMDIRIPGVSNRAIYRYANSLDAGNMGIGMYPRAGFIHIDFRAPGDPSYRWTDHSRPGAPSKGKRPSRHWRKNRRNRPNS